MSNVCCCAVCADRAAEYPYLPAEGVFANCLALIMGMIVFIGVFLVADFDFRRVALTDEKL